VNEVLSNAFRNGYRPPTMCTALRPAISIDRVPPWAYFRGESAPPESVFKELIILTPQFKTAITQIMKLLVLE
jgi:hypothetical protein